MHDNHEHDLPAGIEIEIAIPIAVAEPDGEVPQAVLNKVEQQIQQAGFCIVADATEPVGNADGVTFTVGLHKRELPDLITLGHCRCTNAIVGTLAERQLKAGAYTDGQITQVEGEIIRLRDWPHTANLSVPRAYYGRYPTAPTMLLAELVE